MPAAVVAQSQRVVPLSNQPDKCADQRLCWTSEITFDAPGDEIRLTVQSSSQPNQPQFDVVRGLFIFLRARTDAFSGADPWLEVSIPITGQRWDLGKLNSLSPWESVSMQVPVYMPATGDIVLTYRQGAVPVDIGDCVVILTNFEVAPYIVSGSSNNEVG